MNHSEGHVHDAQGSKLGMWLFLFSEILLFTGLFILYAVYLSKYPEGFIAGGKELSTPLGATNTAVLLTSSLFVAVSVAAMQRGSANLSLILVACTVLCALAFLGIKYVEWSGKIAHGIYPDSPILNGRPRGEIIFFSLYYMITGLHALHVIAGASVLVICMVLVYRKRITEERYVFLENSGLYWHLVDIIWIFIFPLFYLII